MFGFGLNKKVETQGNIDNNMGFFTLIVGLFYQ